MSTPRDRREYALGAFMASQDGPAAVRDALSDEAIKEFGRLTKGCDAAEAGRYLIDFLLADAGMQSSMKYAEAQERRQIRMELAEAGRSERMASQLGGDIGYVIGAMR